MKIEPKHATFAQSKWLKEKGFNVPCRAYYHERFEDKSEPDETSTEDSNDELHKEAYCAPEQWKVVEWLRINHGLWLYCEQIDLFNEIKYGARYCKDKENNSVNSIKYNSPQEAYSAAFDYIKNNNWI